MTLKLLTEHRLELLILKRGYTGSSESTLVKMPIVGNHMSNLLFFTLKPNQIIFHQKDAWYFGRITDTSGEIINVTIQAFRHTFVNGKPETKHNW